MKLFQYAILWTPTEDEHKEGKRARIIVEPTPVLARDQDGATMLAGRAIPAESIDSLDQLEIAVRPF
jgi:hypothetical protein